MHYTLSQWLLLFFTYCFLGWIWECCYVSIQKRKWVNRGFLRGPALPIYGFGAIIILVLTYPFEDNIPLIFIIGLIGASTLEYVTGAAMEKLFHMRYWDYSNHRFNINGHISLFVSIGWGFLSVLLVKVLNPPITKRILDIPHYIAEPMSLIFTIAFVIDATKSVQAAFDMKKILQQMTENNKLISSIEEKLNDITLNISQTSDELREYIESASKDIEEILDSYKDQDEVHKQVNRFSKLEIIQRQKHRKFTTLDLLNEKVDKIVKETQEYINSTLSKPEQGQLSKALKDLDEIKHKLKRIELNIASRKDKEYKEAANLIRRNPTSISKRFKDAFEEIKALNKSKETKKKK